jgi:hypothetical protein
LSLFCPLVVDDVEAMAFILVCRLGTCLALERVYI